MNRIDFPSIQNPSIRYTWNRSAFDSPWRWDWRGSAPLHACAGYFETYGDGTVQHSTEYPVRLSDALDYLASLAAYLDEHNDQETLEMLANDWPKPRYNICPAAVKFAAELRHKEGKTTYYNREERKTSSAEAKKHDKRWEEVPTWANGDIDAIVGILFGDCRHEPLERFATVDKIADIIDGLGIDRRPTYYQRAELAGFVPRRGSDGWDYSDANHRANDIHSAFTACNFYVESQRSREWARRSFSCLKNNYIDRHAKTAEATEVA